MTAIITSRQRKVDLPLAGILGIALLLRCLFIANRGIWYDDAFSIFLSRQSFTSIVSGTAADTMPPLYYFLLHIWMRFGQQIWILRSLNVILSLGIVALAYLWVLRLFGRGAALWAAAFTAVSSFQVYHAQELRMYALLALSLLGYIWFFTRLWQTVNDSIKSSWHDWLGLSLCGAAAMYSHNLAVFTLIAPGLLVLAKRKWRFLIAWMGALAAILLMALPWLLMIPGQVEKIQKAFWTPRPGVVEILQALVQANANLPLPAGLLMTAVFICLLVLVLVIWEMRKNHWWDENTQLLLVLAIVPPALMFVVSYIMRPIFVPRAFVPSMIAYYALAARVAAKTQVRPVGWFVGLALIMISLVSLPPLYSNDSFPRSPFQSAASYLTANIPPDSLVIHDNKLSYFPMAYYAPGLQQVFLPDAPGSQNDTLARATEVAMGITPQKDLSTAITGVQDVYFVVFTETIQEYQQMGMEQHPSLAWLDRNMKPEGHIVFNDLQVFEYKAGP